MELKKRTVKYYESVMEKSIVHSESAEMIVSDAYPDFERIVSAVGNVFIKDKTAQNGRVLISGVAKVTALCKPEAGGKIHRVDVPVNFAHVEEGTLITQKSYISVQAAVRNIEPRLVNPRKIFVRVNISLKITAYEASEKEICYEIASEENENLQLLKNQYETMLAIEIKEKSFTVIEDVDIDQVAETHELCGHKISVRNEETRLTKNKAVVKGSLMVHLTALNAATSELRGHDFRLPFSQILEMEGIDETCELKIASHIKNADFVVGGGETGTSRKLQCMVSVEIFAVAYAKQIVNAVCDVYSTNFETTLETAPCVFTSPGATRERIVEVNEAVKLDSPVLSVIDSSVSLSAPEMISDPQSKITSTAYVSVLYQNTANELSSGTAAINVDCMDPVAGKDGADISCECSSYHVSANPDGSVQVSMSVLFETEEKVSVKIPHIKKVSLNHDRKNEQNRNLSLILTYMPGGESLWSVAKRYNTTASQIASANGFTADEKIPQGRMLLIPIER
ncbi:MAG: DUF3794 domain-containing protein [Bacillota bacterium]|nr:DUF3794 domain-containing protein [Bacillota bacterium]